MKKNLLIHANEYLFQFNSEKRLESYMPVPSDDVMNYENISFEFPEELQDEEIISVIGASEGNQPEDLRNAIGAALTEQNEKLRKEHKPFDSHVEMEINGKYFYALFHGFAKFMGAEKYKQLYILYGPYDERVK